MTSGPYPHFSGVDKLIIAAQIESNRPTTSMSGSNQIPNSLPFQAGAPLYPHQYTSYPSVIYHHPQQQSQLPSQPHQHHQISYRDTHASSPCYLREQILVPTPKNKSELELYHLLRQANLLDYFPTFLKYGGDDVDQLAEAEEDEFLEIIKLVGMNQKPLHVRRFEKALLRWRDEKLEIVDALEDRKKFIDTFGFYVNQPMMTQTRCSSKLDESTASISTASRSLFPTDEQSSTADQSQPQYCTPHEVIVNAPKKPRLMDSIMSSDLTKGIQDEDSSVKSTPARRGRPPKYQSQSRDSPASETSESGAEISAAEKKSISKRKKITKKTSGVASTTSSDRVHAAPLPNTESKASPEVLNVTK